MVTDKWREQFPEMVVDHGPAYKSDHNPLIVKLHGEDVQVVDKQFRFEAMWISHPKFAEVVEEGWTKMEETAVSVAEKLKGCAQIFKEWNRFEFGHVQERIRDLKRKIEVIRTVERTRDICLQEQAMIKELDEWLWREEVMWRQRARVQWLREGDQNSSYFHAKASKRRKTNLITELKDRDGVMQRTNEGMVKVAELYFEDVFKSRLQGDDIDWQEALSGIDMRVSEGMNAALLEPVTDEEIKHAVFQMAPTKAPGVDGYPAIIDEGVNPGELNVSKIVLIPKRTGATEMQYFRPISLCNVIMRIVSKVMANRLKVFLPQIISEAQSAFISGRLISDNILLAHEMSHFIKSRKGNGQAYMSVKLDMCKAYDKMEWIFLERMLAKLGFSERWISKLMVWLRSVTYVVKVNHQLSKTIIPSRGLRQGDPLSPYLFILGSEWLSRTLEKGEQSDSFKGLRISRFSPCVSHLLFADDSLIFSRAGRGDVEYIKATLKKYELLSGQQINLEKSTMVCSPNLTDHRRREAERILEVSSVNKHDRYLGLPLIVGQRKTEVFREIEEKAAGRILSWSSKLLSMAGREVLIKSIIMAIPQFAMTCYKLPRALCDKLQKLAIKYWWSGDGNARSIHCVKQSVLLRDKADGGLGFYDLRMMNEAFLIKQAWRLLTQPELLLSRVMRGRYFTNGGFRAAGVGSKPSHAWRGICSVKHWLVAGVGDWDGESRPEWRLDSSGVFSVKSIYKHMMNQAVRDLPNQGEQSDMKMVNVFWRKVWKAIVPNRVKTMVWRLFHDALPDAVNLRKRGCDPRQECALCGFVGETALHIVRNCWKAKVFWNRANFEKRWWEREGGSSADWLFYCASMCKQHEFQKLMVGVWLLWNNRNAVIHEGIELSVEEMVVKLQTTIYQCDAYLGRKLYVKLPNILLTANDMKEKCIFCDGAWRVSGSEVGLAAIYVEGGYIQAVNFQWIEQGVLGRDVEGLALLLGMRLAERLKIRVAVIISDSLDVVQAVEMGGDRQRRELCWLDGCVKSKESNPGWTIKHARREENTVADSIAHLALRSKASWFDVWSIPWCVRQCVIGNLC